MTRIQNQRPMGPSAPYVRVRVHILQPKIRTQVLFFKKVRPNFPKIIQKLLSGIFQEFLEFFRRKSGILGPKKGQNDEFRAKMTQKWVKKSKKGPKSTKNRSKTPIFSLKSRILLKGGTHVFRSKKSQNHPFFGVLRAF